MRQWLVPTEYLCDRHLLGEHLEHHMFVGSLNKNKSIKGFIEKGLVEPLTLQKRHDDLVREMSKRKMNHKSPLNQLIYLNKEGSVNIEQNIKELKNRCEKCRERILNYENNL